MNLSGYLQIAMIATLLSVAGCQKGPAEQAGAKLDNAVESAGDAVEDATDKAGAAIENAGDKID